MPLVCVRAVPVVVVVAVVSVDDGGVPVFTGGFGFVSTPPSASDLPSCNSTVCVIASVPVVSAGAVGAEIVWSPPAAPCSARREHPNAASAASAINIQAHGLSFNSNLFIRTDRFTMQKP